VNPSFCVLKLFTKASSKHSSLKQETIKQLRIALAYSGMLSVILYVEIDADASAQKIEANNTIPLTSGVTFKINPQEPFGHICCNNTNITNVGQQYDFVIGTVLKCTFEGDHGFKFSSWSVLNNESKKNITTFRISQDMIINVNFEPQTDFSNLAKLVSYWISSAFNPSVFNIYLLIALSLVVVFIVILDIIVDIVHRKRKKQKNAYNEYDARINTTVTQFGNTVHNKETYLKKLASLEEEITCSFEKGIISEEGYEELYCKILNNTR
jgi:hypothetical protein